MFMFGMDYDQFKTMTAEVGRAENCKEFKQVRVNELVWNLLSSQTKKFDERMQVVQIGWQNQPRVLSKWWMPWANKIQQMTQAN